MEPRPDGGRAPEAAGPPERLGRGTPRVRAYVGLGANLRDPPARLAAAIAALDALPAARVTAVSRLYRTRPVGLVAQPDFLNAVVALDVPTGSSPARGAMALLMALKSIERALGRQDRERWGPREIDLDLLLFGAHRIRVPRDPAAHGADPSGATPRWLEVPHPEAERRLFVLAPWADLAPDLAPPGWARTVGEASRQARLREGPDAVRPVARWDVAARTWEHDPMA